MIWLNTTDELVYIPRYLGINSIYIFEFYALEMAIVIYMLLVL